MNDNLKEAFKELENLDVCDKGKETIKKIFCKALGEEYEKGDNFIHMKETHLYLGTSKKSNDNLSLIVKIPKEYTHIFISLKDGDVSHTHAPDDVYPNREYFLKAINGEAKITLEEDLPF